MQTYLLAANLFALTALLLGLNDFSKGRHSWRLLPLFLLVVSRSVSLIISLATDEGPATTASTINALEVFSAFCLVWALINPFGYLSVLWQRLAWFGGGLAVFLALLSLFPDWPVPYQIHILTIAIFGASLILVSLGRVSWVHLAAPIVLALAYFLSLLGSTGIFGLVVLLAYGFVIGALHWESVQAYLDRQQASDAIAQDAIYLSQERQRLLEVSEIISAVPNLDQSMEHVARSMAHITHSDQSVVLMLDVNATDQVRPAVIYSPERPVDLKKYIDSTFSIANYTPLQAAIDQQQQILLYPHSNGNGLASLYAMWQEDRSGPTMIQPLLVQGKAIGALILGNPVTEQPIQEHDQTLCRNLASQIAVMVEAYRHNVALQSQVEALTAQAEKTTPEPTPALVPEGVGVGEVSRQPVAVKTAPAPVTGEIAQPQTIVTPMLPAPVIQLDFEEADSYLAIIEALQEGVVVSNVSGRVQLVNKAAERILGKSRQKLLGRPISTIYGKITSTESIEELATAFSRRNQPLPTFFEDDERAIQGQLIPWRNPEREWLGILAVFTDVTLQVKADRARNDFISALSRALRGPLTIIKGYTELITAGRMANYSPEQLQVQRIIHSSAEQIAQVLNNAIQINAQNQGKIVPRFKDVDVIAIMEAALAEVAALAELQKLELVKEIRTELPSITADGGQLLRILENLLSNACHFTPPGGRVVLQAWVQQEREGNTEHPYLILAVADNGVGIPKMEQKRIFDSFYQLDNQRPDHESSGIGMGLAVVKELVELHNGRVWVESTPGVGSIFQVAIPLSQN